MSKQEMRQYRQKTRAATSDEERQQIRSEHHKEMQERAKKKGVKLPDGDRNAIEEQGHRRLT